MAIFAEKLKSYIEKSGQTIYMVAQSSGVNRTLIHRMTTGARIPSKKRNCCSYCQITFIITCRHK